MDDDSFINPGNDTLFHETPEHKNDREEHENEVITEAPIIEEVIKRFEERINHYKSVDAVDKSVLADEKKFMNTIAANKVIVEILQQEKGDLETLVKEFDQE